MRQLFHHFCWLLLLFPVLLAACEREPLRLGFVGGLTGKVAGLGTAGRDGALLAVDEANRNGGIGGRRVELLIRDDRQDRQAVQQAVEELAQTGAAAIIGPMTSEMAVHAAPVANRLGVVLMAPTVATPLLSGQDDYFFRLYPSSDLISSHVARLVTERGQVVLSVILDTSNHAYTHPWLEQFRAALERHGGSVGVVVEFDSRDHFTYLEVAQKALAAGPQGILILASPVDTAMVCQQLRKLGFNLPVMASEWSLSDDILQFGGSAVEGLTLFHTYNARSATPGYRDFSERFVAHFGYQPGFAGMLGYEAASLVLSTLRQDPEPANLKLRLIGQGTVRGVQTEFRLDRFGDVVRPLYLTTIRAGRFVVEGNE